jgi:hypothetical protein
MKNMKIATMPYYLTRIIYEKYSDIREGLKVTNEAKKRPTKL